jgi:hypothetical protein
MLCHRCLFSKQNCQFFVPGVVVPLIATVGINNKVTFLEKGGTSVFPNSTGCGMLIVYLSHSDHDLGPMNSI